MEALVGTAGHIDHGKTALIKALTGIDADRLPEEKRRGITVDIGFAEMTAGDVHLGFVDVPGHERFIKNMLAGVSGIDLVMFVIASDEGVMPQTREHFDICRLLGIKAGVVVLTKTDIVDAETLEFAKLAAADLVAGSFLEDAPVICVSARTGDGLDDLKAALRQITMALPDRNDQLVARLSIDRSFTMRGFGAVVTGTLASGEISEGAELELLPAGKMVRIRGLQSHGRRVTKAAAGQRVAINLGGIDHSKIMRGMLLAEPNMLRPTQIIDAEIEVLPAAAKPLRSRQRVRVHIGTIEALARIQVLNKVNEIAAGETDLVQLRFEGPVTAVLGERFIVRSYSPQSTIAGGRVIEIFAVKHRRKEIEAVWGHLHELSNTNGDSSARIRITLKAAGKSGMSFTDLQARTALRKEVLVKAIYANIASGAIVDSAGHYIATEPFDALSKSTEAAIAEFHKRENLAKGMQLEAIREHLFFHLPHEVFQAVITSLAASGKIVRDNEIIRLASHKTILSTGEAELREKIMEAYRAAGLEVPKLEDALAGSIAGTNFTRQEARKFFQMFLDSGEIVKVTEEFYFARSAIDKLADMLRQFASTSSDRLIDMAKFKELAGISRKYAIPLLEYFDSNKITKRAGDKRLIL